MDAQKLTDIRQEAEITLAMQSDHDWSQSYVDLRAKETLELLDYIKELEAKTALLKTEIKFKVGDVVHEVGDSKAETGEIVHLTEYPHGTGYRVKLFNPLQHVKSVIYYEDEIEFVRRGNG